MEYPHLIRDVRVPDDFPHAIAYTGACAPRQNGLAGSSQATFSVGIFEIKKKARGKGLKRGTVIKRISGSVTDPGAVYASAEAWIAANRQA